MTRIGDNAILKLAQDGLSREQVQEVIAQYKREVDIHRKIMTDHEAIMTRLEVILREKEPSRPDEQ